MIHLRFEGLTLSDQTCQIRRIDCLIIWPLSGGVRSVPLEIVGASLPVLG